MSDDLYLPRHITIDNTQEYQSDLLARLSNPNHRSHIEQTSRPPQAKKATRKRKYNVKELNVAYGLPKDLSQNFSKWFYGDIARLKSRPAPVAGLRLEPIQPRIDVKLCADQFKYLSQDLPQLETEPFGLLKRCIISVSEGNSGQDPSLNIILESRTTFVDRRPAQRKQRQINSRSNGHRSDSLVAPDEDCDDTGLDENW